MAQLAQGLGLYLADALPGDIEELANFLKRVVALFGNAKTLAQNLFLAGGKIGQNRGKLFGELGVDHFLGRGNGFLVLYEIAKAGILLIANGRFK